MPPASQKLLVPKEVVDSHIKALKNVPIGTRQVCTIPGCFRQTSTLWNLQKHLETHIESRPYTLFHEECGQGFHRPGELGRHILLCTNNLPECGVCGIRMNSFIRADRLRQHESQCEGTINVHSTSVSSTSMSSTRSYPTPSPSPEQPGLIPPSTPFGSFQLPPPYPDPLEEEEQVLPDAFEDPSSNTTEELVLTGEGREDPLKDEDEVLPDTFEGTDTKDEKNLELVSSHLTAEFHEWRTTHFGVSMIFSDKILLDDA
ncbi:hypothetical protein M427DRAFT_63738 [Gonapodya prolifera JEL478]|uniref:C2H2-type domain-containing protein n=1 Tax=Gonapodya prolifera (strain JEL478) TaxID=1344416 RepID=A0A138ZYV2_GONPJ|nr:hypothetical protein M427DRAFT_63738 [Gonapodya prolifera JEL478]|eukprot:KXS09661.1 hypothetical protein M427DRAFT_63738 [Gonapodya prolifera JEL478]